MLIILLFALFDYLNIPDSRLAAILIAIKIFVDSIPITNKTFMKQLYNLYKFPKSKTFTYCNKCERVCVDKERCNVRN